MFTPPHSGFRGQNTFVMSEEASKALVRRPQGGAVASVSGPPVRKRAAKTALEEEEFTEVGQEAT